MSDAPFHPLNIIKKTKKINAYNIFNRYFPKKENNSIILEVVSLSEKTEIEEFQIELLHFFKKELQNDYILRTNQKVDITSFGIRNARDNENFTALDGKEITLNENTHLITCNKILISLNYRSLSN